MSRDNIHTRLLEKQEYAFWDDFVDKSAMGTLFHKTIWLENISKWQNLRFDIAGCFKGEELVGGMAFTWKVKMKLFRIIQMPVKTPLFGIVISERPSEHVSKHESHIHSISYSITEYLEQRFGYIYSLFPSRFNDVRPFSWNHYIPNIHYSYQYDLHSKKDLLSSLYPSLRRQITKSLTLDFKVKKDNSEKMVSEAWGLEQKSFERQGFKSFYPTRDEFTSFLMKLISEDAADIYTIIHSDRGIASNIILKDHFAKTAYFWLAGVDSEFISTGLNQVLVLKTIEDLKSSGLEIFDFGGAGTGSIAKYKSRYNFPLVSMYSISKAKGLTRYALLLKKLFK